MNNQGQNFPQAPAPVPGKGQAIAGMVLGICSLVIPYAGTVLAIVGLVLSVLAKNILQAAGQPFGMATAGIVMSIIAIAWSIVLIIICVTCFAAVGAGIGALEGMDIVW